MAGKTTDAHRDEVLRLYGEGLARNEIRMRVVRASRLDACIDQRHPSAGSARIGSYAAPPRSGRRTRPTWHS